MSLDRLTIPALRAAYGAGELTPTALCQELLPKIAASHAVFISKPRPDEVYARCKCVGGAWGAPEQGAPSRCRHAACAPAL